MFDPNTYRSACDRLAPDAEKLEEWITMTENKSKKYLSRPVKALLIAAACLTLLCATALAAPAVQQLFTTFTITYRNGDSSTAFTLPTLALEEREGRSILTVDDVETDVTDAFAQNGQYTLTADGATITVKPDGWVEVQAPGDEETGPITYSYNLLTKAPVSGVGNVKIATEDDVDSDAFGSYEVTLTENGDIEVTDCTPAE